MLAGWDARAIRAAESIALLLAVHWVLIGTILAIHVTIARPPLGDTVSVAALEIGDLAGVIDGGTVGFVGPVPAVVVPIAHPGRADAHAGAAAVLVAPALVHFTVTFIAVVATVVLKVTFIGEWDAGPRLLAAELGVQITDGSRYKGRDDILVRDNLFPGQHTHPRGKRTETEKEADLNCNNRPKKKEKINLVRT